MSPSPKHGTPARGSTIIATASQLRDKQRQGGGTALTHALAARAPTSVGGKKCWGCRRHGSVLGRAPVVADAHASGDGGIENGDQSPSSTSRLAPASASASVSMSVGERTNARSRQRLDHVQILITATPLSGHALSPLATLATTALHASTSM